MNVIITFANGSSDTVVKPSYVEAIRFARHGISYSGGRVQRVEIETEPGSLRAVWDASWDGISNNAGLYGDALRRR